MAPTGWATTESYPTGPKAPRLLHFGPQEINGFVLGFLRRLGRFGVVRHLLDDLGDVVLYPHLVLPKRPGIELEAP